MMRLTTQWPSVMRESRCRQGDVLQRRRLLQAWPRIRVIESLTSKSCDGLTSIKPKYLENEVDLCVDPHSRTRS